MVELLRSWMFTPANRDPMLAKAGSLGADVTVIDLEDAVPPREKQDAAVNVRRYYRPIRERNPRGRLYVRINAVEKPAMSHGGDYYEARGIEDIRHVVGEGLDGIILPKSESASMLHRAAAALEVMERERGLPVGTTRILVLIETVRGLTDIARIAEAAAKEPRVIGFCFGAGDFTLDADMEWSRGEAELVPARFAVALWARRAGFQHVIDSPWARLGDLEGYRASAQQAARLGFTGKWCLHPNQVSICNEVFLPTEEQYRGAKRALGVMAEALSRGEGSVMHEGRLLELPLVERARRIVELYEAAKKGDGE